MEYPGSKLTRPLRLGVLIFFILAFFVISPLVIILSAGFRFDIKNGLLRETGSLSVDVSPDTASVFLDGLKIDQKLPIRLNNITPHKYTLRLSAPGYYEWEKIIDIKNNQTTYIKELNLIKKTKPTLVTDKNVETVSVAPSGEYVAYATRSKNNVEIFIHNTKTNISNTAVKIASVNKLLFTWSQFSNYLTVSSAVPPFEQIHIINASQPTKSRILNNANGAPIQKYIWSKDIEPKLYFESEKKLSSYLPRLDQTNFMASSTFQDWYLEEGSLWTLEFSTSTGALSVISDSLGFKNNFFTISPNDQLTSSSLKSLKIKSVRENTVILASHESEKYYIVRNDKFFTVNGKNMLYSNYNNWLLIWTPWELWTYSRGDEPYLLNRSGDELLDLLPIDEYNTLALIWKDSVSVLHPYFLTQRTIIDSAINSISADTVSRTIYYSNNNGLWKLSY